MQLRADELSRVEAMLARGQVASEPPTLSRIDRMLQRLLVRARRATPAPATPATAHRARAARDVDWLDLPALEELLAARQALLRPEPPAPPFAPGARPADRHTPDPSPP